MTITFVRADFYTNTRLQKWIKYFYSKGFEINYIGWNRLNETNSDSRISNIKFILNGHGYQNIKIKLLYILYIIKLFIFLISNKRSRNIYFAIDIFSAFPFYLVNVLRLKKVNYIYEIRDEFSKSYKLNKVLKYLSELLDHQIRAKSILVIHVDDNRVDAKDSNYIVINNSPFDFYQGGKPQYIFTKSYAITGWLSDIRGLKSIYKFADENKDIGFIIAGNFIDTKYKELFLSLSNVNFIGFVPQEDLFEKIKHCSGIFSLYDPSFEINKLAASNKLYDSMMLGIPVITNNEILPAEFVKTNQIGFTVNYNFDASWEILKRFDIDLINFYGNSGRNLYELCYDFNKQLENRFLPHFLNITKKYK